MKSKIYPGYVLHILKPEISRRENWKAVLDNVNGDVNKVIAKTHAEYVLPLEYAFMMIDMQAHYLEHLPSSRNKRLIDAQMQILEFCAEQDILVFDIGARTLGKTIFPLQKKLLDIPRKYRFFKPEEDAFSHPKLLDRLLDHGITHLCLTGVQASACVLETMKGVVRVGLYGITSENLVGDDGYQTFFNKRAQNFFNYNIGNYCGNIEETLTTMRETRRMPCFSLAHFNRMKVKE